MTPSALATDFYELTMAAAYDVSGLDGRATFELFVRHLPRRAYLVAAGLEQALDFLEHFQLTADEIDWLATSTALRVAPRSFFTHTLTQLRFTGDVWAMPEGTPFFAYEPVLRVSAPIIEAQLVETALLALITFQTTIASKAARIVWAASGRDVMEFGSRRAHGIDAGIHAARAAYLAGFDSTSNVEAGRRFGVPLSGTMAHSWVTAFADEIEAFARYADVFGPAAVFLIDTYDTLNAARRIVEAGLRPRGVRLDSGDLVHLSKEVRRILDGGGLESTQIYVSGDMDEWSVAHVLAQGAPIDGFGVGTALATSIDAPALGGVYKLVEVERGGTPHAVMKLSGGGKSSYPGRKQVWRIARGGQAAGDVIGVHGETAPAGAVPLLERVMRRGQRIVPSPALDAVRARHQTLVSSLPRDVRMLDPRQTYPVSRSAALESLTERTVAALSADTPSA